MYEEYGTAYQTYKAKYGSKTAIFLMVGAFYELYDIQDRVTGETVFNVKEVCDFLGIAVTQKRDLPKGHENSFGLFAGFPDYTLHKHAARLTANGWTVVVIDQVKDEKGLKVLRREVARILSPSTHVEAMDQFQTPYLTVLVFHNLQFGLATLDLTTGTTMTYHGQGQGHTDVWTADDIQQQLSLYCPKELLVYDNKGLGKATFGLGKATFGLGKATFGLGIDESFVRRQFSVPPSTPVHVRPVITSLEQESLRKAYSIQSMLPIKEYLSLRTDLEESALLHLIHFAKEHMPTAVKAFQRNVPWIPEQNLLCGNHALQQLQMDSVVALFHSCLTPMGKRDIRQRLLKPLTHAASIQNRLQEVAEFLDWPPTKAKSLEASLRFIGDLPRLHRKCQLGTLTSQDFVTLGQSYVAIQDMWALFQDFFQPPKGLQESFERYTAVWTQHIDENKALNASEDITVFMASQYPEIGSVEMEIGTVLGQFEVLRASMCSGASLSPDAIRLEGREKEPFGLKASTNVLKALQVTKNRGLTIQALKSGGWIDCPELDTLNRRLVKLREQLGVLSRDTVLKATSAISLVGALTVWSSLEEWISHVDCTRCIARTARERGFHPPTVIDSNTDSFLDLEGLRHPLVETTGTRIAYVQHSVKLDQDTNSWLVYGMNASGKSTLMKATGIAILLAQAGSYVPALRLRFRPFKAIYTRILNHDNLFAGLSSFAVEMSELRDILRQANEHSLVLGDEMCSGTESLSAMSLVAAGIEWLSAKRAKFIFATHLHDLPSLVDCAALKLKVWHLRVEYDSVSQKLIYDRTLIPGSGSSLYGLEVAKAMDLPLEFLEKARTHRKALMGFDGGTSSWNSAIKRNLCELCGNPVALEVHHIQERHTAKNGLLPDGTPMNAVANLVVLCQSCHDKEHTNAIVYPIVQTSTGPDRLLPSNNQATTVTTTTTKSSKTKWSDEDRTAIDTVLKEYKKASLKALSCKLRSEYQIEISWQSLAAIRKTLC